jgi:hypothetical protein
VLGLARQVSLADMAFWPTTKKQGKLSPPSAPMACRQNLAGRRPVVGGGVVGEQASRVVDRIGGGGEGGLTGRIIHGGGDWRRGKDVSKPE